MSLTYTVKYVGGPGHLEYEHKTHTIYPTQQIPMTVYPDYIAMYRADYANLRTMEVTYTFDRFEKKAHLNL